MTIYDFLSLDEMEQAEAIWDGTFIADREDEEYRILLYQIDSFYVEAYYHKKHNALHKFRPFKNTELLEPYLKNMDIRKFFK